MDGINPEKKMMSLTELIPNEGDTVTIINCGNTYQFQVMTWAQQLPPLSLTEADIEKLKRGDINFN